LAAASERAVITLKQVEALHWIVQLGSFERAAAKLNTTQSAISKRIQELEAASSITMFDRSQRGARLTEMGEHLLSLGGQMLALRERMLDLKDARDMPARRLRLGVTELTALTWLPRLVAALREAYPMVALEPEVDMSRTLHERLQDDTIDLIVIPETFSDPKISSLRLGEIENAWMASPTLVRANRRLSLEELARYTILTQGSKSGSGLYVGKWLKSEGIVMPQLFSCDSLVALLGLTIAGIGVSYLPVQCFKPLVAERKLRIVRTRPALPRVPYAAMHRNDRPFAFTALVATLARSVCDFTRPFQG
jgi:DNA-binding transcriptional LysR family regulator